MLFRSKLAVVCVFSLFLCHSKADTDRGLNRRKKAENSWPDVESSKSRPQLVARTFDNSGKSESQLSQENPVKVVYEQEQSDSSIPSRRAAEMLRSSSESFVQGKGNRLASLAYGNQALVSDAGRKRERDEMKRVPPSTKGAGDIPQDKPLAASSGTGAITCLFD